MSSKLNVNRSIHSSYFLIYSPTSATKACFLIRELGYKRHSDGHLWGNEVNTVTGKTNK